MKEVLETSEIVRCEIKKIVRHGKRPESFDLRSENDLQGIKKS